MIYNKLFCIFTAYYSRAVPSHIVKNTGKTAVTDVTS
jgi:hypothetical protein